MKCDIVIIGGGVIGSAIARELGKFNLETVMVEKEDDIAMGTSKANSGIIHAGYNAADNTIKGKLNAKANPLFDDLANKLKFPFKRIGSLVVGFNKEDLQVLLNEKENGEKLGVNNLQIIKKGKLMEMEPNINPDAEYALYAPTAGIISPYEYAIALADNAVINGVKVLLETEVTGIITKEKQIIGVKTNTGKIETRIVINAAGLFSDRIALLAGDDSFKIKARKGEYHLLDKNWGDFVKHVLFPIPDKHTKGILVTPTVHGNLLFGPNSYEIEEKDDLSVTEEGLDEIYYGARKLLPGLSRSEVIASFSGLRAAAEGNDFIIDFSDNLKGMINVGGIQSPGLSSTPAITEMVIEMVKELTKTSDINLDMSLRDDFQEENPERVHLVEYLDKGMIDKWQEFINKNSDYGEIICRCEMVTRGEIIEAIRRPVKAKSLDAIKRRTRAGGGRCQGGFCSPRVLSILADELGVSPVDINKKGQGSELLMAEAKELIREKAGVNNDR